ncbi:MAG TPA: DUF1844 domain-containing protein [Thermoanaerobaculia bacterium]|nr:DUF1844 domain-containing protein [Thermoanaerobaculia bacterium]
MSGQDKEIKVTDKRMFTASGELREEFRFIEDAPATPSAPPEPPPAEPPQPERPPGGRERQAGAGPAWPEPPASSSHLEFPDTPAGMGPGFFDLAAMLAEPAAIYLGDAPLPDGQSAEDLEMARMHIDMLDVLRQKTAGNLTAQEAAFLEDLLYRLRVRYVQKRG